MTGSRTPNGMHLPRRPSWDCAACDKPWPCAPAKVLLSEEFEGNRLSLSVYMSAQLHDALNETATNDSGHRIGDLFDRFMDWLPAGPGHRTKDRDTATRRTYEIQEER